MQTAELGKGEMKGRIVEGERRKRKEEGEGKWLREGVEDTYSK